MRTFAEQFVALGMYTAPRTVVRRVRHIINAIVNHGYTALNYIEYSDGAIEFVGETTLSISQTNVRLKAKDTSQWEENIKACPGWFRCNKPEGISS